MNKKQAAEFKSRLDTIMYLIDMNEKTFNTIKQGRINIEVEEPRYYAKMLEHREEYHRRLEALKVEIAIASGTKKFWIF